MKGSNEMTDNTAETESTSTPEVDTGKSTRIRPRRPGKGPKPIRWSAEKAETLQRHAAALNDGTARRAAEDARATAASDDTGGDLGLSPEDWAAAGATMAREATEAQGDAADGDDDGDDSDALGPGWRDAFAPAPEGEPEPEPAGRDARYRRRLKDAEAANDRLSTALAEMQSAEVQRIAADRMADARDLFINVKLADLLDGDRVDPDRVNAAIDRVLTEKPHWQRPNARYTGELRSGSSQQPVEKSGPSWRDAFAPAPEE